MMHISSTLRPWIPVSIDHTFIMSDTATPGHDERFTQTHPYQYIPDNSVYHVWFYILNCVGKNTSIHLFVMTCHGNQMSY